MPVPSIVQLSAAINSSKLLARIVCVCQVSPFTQRPLTYRYDKTKRVQASTRNLTGTNNQNAIANITSNHTVYAYAYTFTNGF